MTQRLRRQWSRWSLVLAVLVIAPWTAECSWGGFTATEFLYVVLFLAPLYGGAAVLIRETARRTGGGWPVITVLGAAFGVFQAGLVDQSLINPAALDDTQFADMAAASRVTLIPWVGISAQQVVDYVGNHVALSICAPIAIVESFPGPARRDQPWLGRFGIAVIALLYILGSALVYSDTAGKDGYAPTMVQLTLIISLVFSLVGTALLLAHRRRRSTPAWALTNTGAPTEDGIRPQTGKPTVGPIRVGALLIAAHVISWIGSPWTQVGLQVTAITVVAVLLVRWSRRPGWTHQHVMAACGAGLVVSAVTAYLVPTYDPASPTAALTGDIAISLVTAILLGTACWRLRTQGRP